MVTTLPSHEVKLGTTTVQTLTGGDAMDPQAESSVAAAAASSSSDPSGDASVAVAPVNNGPGIAKGVPSGSVPTPNSTTVIQTSQGNLSVASNAGPGVSATVVVRPSMQTAGASLTLNGGGNNNNNSSNAVLPGASQTPGQGGQVVLTKTEAPKVVVQTAAGTVALGQPLQTSPGVAKGAVLAGAVRSVAPVSVASSPAGIRTIAPQQVLAPRLPQGAPGQANVQNIQLPPGMVIVRSETGQLLMIHQQVLAQMQAQMQATRATTPVSTTPGQITTTQTPGAPIVARQVAPTLIKQESPAVSTATTALQRPPVQTPAGGSVLSVQPGAAPRVVTPSTGTSITMATETMENVKKCKNFLSTLIKLATSAKQSSQTAANVKLLVKNLLEGTIEAEDFTSRLYKELNSSPQPYLVPFLKRSLPALRQLTPDSLAFIQQSQGLTAKPAASVALTASTTAPVSSVTSAVTTAPAASTAAATAIAATVTAPGTAQRPLVQSTITKPGQPASLVLQSPQQTPLMKSPQVSLANTPMVTLRGQPHSRIVVGQQPVQLKQLQTVAVRPGVVSGAKISPSPMAVAAAQKSKLKDAAGGTFKDDDDINDVASMAGVNLSEESARILATNSELVGAVTRSCKDEAFLSSFMLQRRILDIGKRFGVTEVGPEVVNLVSHATQMRLGNLLEKVSVIAQQKNMTYKEDGRFEQVTDVRSQLKFFEQLDQLEKQRKEEQEREILMKAAKSRSRQEDPEQLRLKQKAKEMQQQELAQIRQRDANLTALAAIGPRKKRKLDSLALGTDAEGSSSSTSSSAGLSGGASRQFTRQRITRVNLRDLLFCLENEKSSSRSQLLYRALLK